MNVGLKYAENHSVQIQQIARDTLTEAGISTRPFVSCPVDLLQYKEEYFKVLSVAKELIPFVNEPETKRES